jgi:hypothetical protein
LAGSFDSKPLKHETFSQHFQLFLFGKRAETIVPPNYRMIAPMFIGLALVSKDIVFRCIIEYSSLMEFDPYVIIGLFLYEDFGLC